MQLLSWQPRLQDTAADLAGISADFRIGLGDAIVSCKQQQAGTVDLGLQAALESTQPAMHGVRAGLLKGCGALPD